MINLIKTTLPFAVVLILAACGGNETQEANHEAHNTAEPTTGQPAAVTSTIFT
jgi:hypothetical protein